VHLLRCAPSVSHAALVKIRGLTRTQNFRIHTSLLLMRHLVNINKDIDIDTV